MIIASLPDGVDFHELPFGGVLLNRQDHTVHRLSQRAAGALRRALDGLRTTGPYESILPNPAAGPGVDAAIIHALAARGLVRLDG